MKNLEKFKIMEKINRLKESDKKLIELQINLINKNNHLIKALDYPCIESLIYDPSIVYDEVLLNQILHQDYIYKLNQIRTNNQIVTYLMQKVSDNHKQLLVYSNLLGKIS
jgi:hypothetical protein